MRSLEEWVVLGGMGHSWRNVSFREMCHFRSNVPYLEEYVIFGGMCQFWRNVPFLEECVIFGGMCHLWRNVTFLEESDIWKKILKVLKITVSNGQLCLLCKLQGGSTLKDCEHAIRLNYVATIEHLNTAPLFQAILPKCPSTLFLFFVQFHESFKKYLLSKGFPFL